MANGGLEDEAQDEDPDLGPLARAVKEIRRGNGLTQEKVAERAGLSSRHLQALEAMRLNPSYKVLVAIARGLGVPLSYLITLAERDGGADAG